MWFRPRRSAVAVVLLSVSLLALLAGVSVAKECTLKKGLRAWKHSGGTFIREEQGVLWRELDKNGNQVATFSEKMQQEGQVVLFDAKRALHLLLRSNLAAVQENGDQNFHQLYEGRFLKTVDCT